MIRWEVIIQQWKTKKSIKTKLITSRRNGVRKREDAGLAFMEWESLGKRGFQRE